MPHLYPHKTKGWRILYRIYLLDGTHIDKIRWSKNKDTAGLIYSDVTKLETLSRTAAITKQEVLYCLNRGYISQIEASLLTSSKVSIHTWDELAKKYEDWSRTNCRSTTHIANCHKLKVVLNCIEKYYPARQPSELTAEDVESYISRRKKQGAKSGTILKEHVILRKLLDYAGADNPARQIRAPKIDDERLPRALSYEDLVIFMRELKNRKKYLRGYIWAVVMLYLYAGLRPSEIIRLTSKDIKVGKILIHGATKTGMLRSIEIHPKLNIYISSCLRRAGKYLCGGDRQLISQSISRAIRHILRKTALDGATPYSLRHTFVTNLLRTSGDLRYTMDKAGHKRLSTTIRYLHIIPGKDSPLKKMRFGGS